MFLKLTDNDSGADVYLNPAHITRFVANPSGEGTLVYMSSDSALAASGEVQVIVVHEPAEEVFRIINRQEKGPKQSPTRGLL